MYFHDKIKPAGAALCLATAVFCGFSSTTVQAQNSTANLTAETVSAGTSLHLAITHLGEVASERGIANIQIADGQTLTNSIQNVAEGKTDISSATYILPFLLANGRGPYSKLGAEKGAELASNLRALYPITVGVFALYAYDSTDLKGWDDLQNRTLYNGPPRGGSLNNARSMIQIVAGLKEGDGYKGLQVNWGQAVKTIKDGSAEGIVLPIRFPDTRITQAVSAGNMTVFSVPKDRYESDAFQAYARAPGSSPWEMPLADANLGDGVTVQSEDGIFRGLGNVGGDIVHKDMDFDLAKALVTAHIETLEQLKSKAPFARTVGYGVLDTISTSMCGANPLKYHPGAIAAWEEAGYEIADCAKPEG